MKIGQVNLVERSKIKFHKAVLQYGAVWNLNQETGLMRVSIIIDLSLVLTRITKAAPAQYFETIVLYYICYYL